MYFIHEIHFSACRFISFKCSVHRNFLKILEIFLPMYNRKASQHELGLKLSRINRATEGLSIQ